MGTLKKIKEFFYRFKNKFKHFLQRTEEFLLREMKEQDLHDFWKYLGSFSIERNREEEAKVFLYAVAIFFLATLIIGGNFIFIGNFHIHYGMTNAQAKEDSNPAIGENSELGTNVETVNEYKMKSSEEICGESKNEKQSSGLCGKDDEEEIKRILDEEKKAATLLEVRKKPAVKASLPYIYENDSLGRRVCNKKNDHPSKSDKGKGKHMDMECCLDPDEIPNPHCYYSSSKYGKYLD